MSDYTRSQMIEALELAWLQVVASDVNFGVPADRLDDSSQRDHLLRCAMEVVWSIHELDKQTPFNDITLTGAAEEGSKSTSRLTSYRLMRDRLEQALETVMGQQVRRLRALGVPWNKVGEACGITAQGIYKKAKQNLWVYGDDSDPELEA